jgi:F-type H+-transporting ATPase subunit b
MRLLPCRVALFLLLLSLSLCAQDAHHAPSQPEHQEAAAPAQHEEHPTLEEQLAEASSEAAHGGEHAEEDHHAAFKYSPSVRWIARLTGLGPVAAYWLALSTNFIIVAGVIVWLWRSNAPQAFRSRTLAIQKGLEEARQSSQEANRRLADVENRLARLDSEIASLRSAAETEALAEEERIRAAAEEDRRKIVEAAEQDIEAASRLARRELKAYVAQLAVSLAEQRIRLDAAEDRALVSNFVEQLANGDRS